MELSGQFPVKKLCRVLDVNRSGFYKWKKRLEHPSEKLQTFVSNITLFKEYHNRYPSHGYRWLNAKIRLDTGLIFSDPYAHKICRTAGIMSISKHYRYKKPGDPFKIYPNLLMTGLDVTGPLQCVVSDMTAFYLKGVYYELTLFMDLWNNEILTYSLSRRRGDRMTYISGLNGLIILSCERSFIPTRVLFMHQRISMNSFRSIISFILCPGPGHRPTMVQWRPSTAGSRRRYSMICISLAMRTSIRRSQTTSGSSTKSVPLTLCIT